MKNEQYFPLIAGAAIAILGSWFMDGTRTDAVDTAMSCVRGIPPSVLSAGALASASDSALENETERRQMLELSEQYRACEREANGAGFPLWGVLATLGLAGWGAAAWGYAAGKGETGKAQRMGCAGAAGTDRLP